MTTRNDTVADREMANQIIDRLANDVELRKDPVAALRDADKTSGTSGDNEDVSGYGMPGTGPIGFPEPTPPYEGGGGGMKGDPTDPPPGGGGGGGPEPTPPYVEGGGQKPAATDKPADW